MQITFSIGPLSQPIFVYLTFAVSLAFFGCDFPSKTGDAEEWYYLAGEITSEKEVFYRDIVQQFGEPISTFVPEEEMGVDFIAEFFCPSLEGANNSVFLDVKDAQAIGIGFGTATH